MSLPRPTGPASSRVHANMDPLRAQLGLRSRWAPTTPPPLPSPSAPPHPPPPPGSARPAEGTGRDRRGSSLAEEAGDVASNAVRQLPHSPVAAAFGAAHDLASAGRRASRLAAAPRDPAPQTAGQRGKR